MTYATRGLALAVDGADPWRNTMHGSMVARRGGESRGGGALAWTEADAVTCGGEASEDVDR